MEGNFMMNDNRFPFYMTDGGKYVVYKGEVYLYHFVDYMNFKNSHGLHPLSPETLAAYLEQLEPAHKDVAMLMMESANYERERREQREREERRAALVKNYLADYENACDDLYYGYGFKFWYERGVKDRLSLDDAKALWRAAVLKMGNTN